MSIDMMNGKIKELRELHRMADELAGEIEAMRPRTSRLTTPPMP